MGYWYIYENQKGDLINWTRGVELVLYTRHKYKYQTKVTAANKHMHNKKETLTSTHSYHIKCVCQ
jgi:hypothetical protein